MPIVARTSMSGRYEIATSRRVKKLPNLREGSVVELVFKNDRTYVKRSQR